MLKRALGQTLLSILAVTLPAAAQSHVAPSTSNNKAAPAEVVGMKGDLIQTAARMVRSGKVLSRIWPGYWPTDQAFILVAAGEGALLISPGPRPTGFEPLLSKDLPPELRGRAFYRAGTIDQTGRPFIPDFPIGNGKTAILVNYAGKGAVPIEGPAISATALALHEQFHVYQTSAFEREPASQFLDPLAVKDRVAFAASAEIEQRVLEAAIKARTDTGRKKLLHQYFALRQEREATISNEVREVEQSFERSEGTARYVDRVAIAHLFNGGAAAVPELIVKELDKDLVRNTGAFGTVWFRIRGYSTGAALSYLLSLYEPRWRQKVEQGAALDQLLRTAVGAPAQAAALAQGARETFGYEERRRQLEAPIRAAEKKELKSVDEFLALDAYAVTLDIQDVEGGPDAIQRGFSARTMVELSPTAVALPVAAIYSLTGPRAALSVKERPVLVETNASRAKTTVLLPSHPKAEGVGELSVGDHRFERLKLSAPGYTLTIDRPVVVTVSPNSMYIRVNEGA